MKRIYLDHAATSPLLPSVASAMASVGWGNPSSLYHEGRAARAAIDSAREILSSALGCLFAEVLFTSSGTEAANMALVGAALAGLGGSRRRILIGSTEHHCVLNCASTLTSIGYAVELIPVDRSGLVSLDALAGMLSDDVLLVSVMHANNELGTVQPVRAVADLAHSFGALYHCDAVQTFLGLLGHVSAIDADIVTISAHKVGGPKGVGAIYTRAGILLKPLISGGGQEREMRGGTENVAGIVGFGEAVCYGIARSASSKQAARDAFLARLDGAVPTVAPEIETLEGHAHVRFPGVSAESMLILLDRMGVSASSGSACSSGSIEPSHVLKACGYFEAEAKEGLRFTFGHDTLVEDAEEAAKRVNEAASQIRGKS